MRRLLSFGLLSAAALLAVPVFAAENIAAPASGDQKADPGVIVPPSVPRAAQIEPMVAPVLMAAATKEQLFQTFMDLLDPLGFEVDVVLETSHHRNNKGHTDLYREHIDLPVLKSILYEYEDLLLNDGCTGIAVLNPSLPQEVQLDEHKLLIVYGKDLRRYENIMVDCHVPCREDMRFITEAEHVHSTSERYLQDFEELKMRLGMDAGR